MFIIIFRLKCAQAGPGKPNQARNNPKMRGTWAPSISLFELESCPSKPNQPKTSHKMRGVPHAS